MSVTEKISLSKRHCFSFFTKLIAGCNFWFSQYRVAVHMCVSIWMAIPRRCYQKFWLHYVTTEMIPCAYTAVQDIQQQEQYRTKFTRWREEQAISLYISFTRTHFLVNFILRKKDIKTKQHNTVVEPKSTSAHTDWKQGKNWREGWGLDPTGKQPTPTANSGLKS